MGKIIDTILSPLAFSRYPVSILALLLYGVVFSSVLFSDSLPKADSSKDFDQAVTDLSKITARPHPYLSHANDHVRSYLLSRIKSIASDFEVIDDINSTVVYSSPGAGVYFEGTNILVKVPGSEKHESNAVLFSAHYDSVSTAPGATDNGIGAVAALHFLGYLANMPRSKRPPRTAIFNLNNNEEDGLYGAHAFMVHPWAKLTTTFLNLDGAGAGGRPMLFRTTGLSPTEAFLKGQPNSGYSHANVISQDAFTRGVIKSGTDWQVYRDTMDGVDLAFYKNRALYHTKFDSLTYAQGGRRSLHAMIEAVRHGGLEMLGAPIIRQGRKDPVYFDVLGRYNYIWEMNTVFVVNVVALVVFPVFLISCSVIYLFVASGIGTDWLSREDVGVLTRVWRGIKVCLGVSQFVIALAVVALLEAALVFGFLRLNPYVVHSQAPLVFVSTLSLAYLSVVFPIAAIKGAGITSTRSKNISLISLYIFTWALLVIYTSVLRGQKIGGLYWTTIWNFLAFLSVLITFAQSIVGLSYRGHNPTVYEEVSQDVEESVQSASSPTRKYVRGIEHVPGSGRAYVEASDNEDDGGDEEDGGVTRETDPTEITPLMHQHRRYGPDGRVVVDAVDDPECPAPQVSQGDETAWWVAQMILGVPIPALLLYEIAVLLLGALPQTLVDGSSAITVYGALAILSTLVFLPIAPFAHKLHGRLNFLVIVIFVATTLYCFFTHPFTQVAPTKVRFIQHVHLGTQTIHPLIEQSPNSGLTHTSGPHYKDEVTSVTTSLIGLSKYVEKVISELPSSHGQDITCEKTPFGLTNCTWSVDDEWIPSPGGKASSDWVAGGIKRVDGKPSQATIHVRGSNTRGCRIYFDQPIYDYKVRALDGDHWDGTQQDGYEVPPEGITKLLLWSRTWDRDFEVRVTFGSEGADLAPPLSGTLACEYSEYVSGIAGAGGAGKLEEAGRIPAFEEVLRFLPKWAVVTKASDGLVEVSRSFSL